MKTVLLILLLTLPFAGQAQSLTGFWGLNFYSSSEQVKERIQARNGKLPDEDSGPDVIGYKNCDFAGFKANYVQLMFHEDQLYAGYIVIQPQRSELLQVYQKLVSDITDKYKSPFWESCLYSYVTQGRISGTEEQSVCAIWKLPAGKKGAGGKIVATIENNIIRLSYGDGLIYDQLTKPAAKTLALDY